MSSLRTGTPVTHFTAGPSNFPTEMLPCALRQTKSRIRPPTNTSKTLRPLPLLIQRTKNFSHSYKKFSNLGLVSALKSAKSVSNKTQPILKCASTLVRLSMMPANTAMPFHIFNRPLVTLTFALKYSFFLGGHSTQRA